MKQGLILIAMLASSHAYACIDLSGRWACKTRDNLNREMQVSQNGSEFTITSYGAGQPVVDVINADGKIREFEMDWAGQRVTANAVAYCMQSRMYATSYIPYDNNQSRVLAIMNMVKTSDTSMTWDMYQDYGAGNVMYNWMCQKQ